MQPRHSRLYSLIYVAGRALRCTRGCTHTHRCMVAGQGTQAVLKPIHVVADPMWYSGSNGRTDSCGTQAPSCGPQEYSEAASKFMWCSIVIKEGDDARSSRAMSMILRQSESAVGQSKHQEQPQRLEGQEWQAWRPQWPAWHSRP